MEGRGPRHTTFLIEGEPGSENVWIAETSQLSEPHSQGPGQEKRRKEILFQTARCVSERSHMKFITFLSRKVTGSLLLWPSRPQPGRTEIDGRLMRNK